VSIPAAATILYGLSQGQSAESFNRQGFAEGGVVGDDTETMSYLTRDTRKAAPYLDNKELITITPTRNLKDFSKGITQTVYRHLKEGTEIENLEDFDLSTQVGVPVHTKNDGHQAGKVRLYNPLDLRQRKIKDFQGYKFVDQLIRHKTIRQIIANNSKLPKAEAHERLKDLIGQYRSDVILVNKQQFSDPQKIEYALNVKVARDAKNILSELGYDSILYNKDGETAAMLFEPGQFRAIKGSAPIQSETDEQMESLGFQRRQYSLGGSISRLLDKVINTKAERIRKGPAPLAFRQMFHDLAGGTDELTEADLRKDEIKGFKKIIREGMKDGTIKKVGRNKWNISYDAYKTHDKSKGETMYADINFKTGIHKIIPKLNNLNFNFKTTVGQGTLIKDKNGNFIVKDQYNFNDSPGLKLQQYFTTPEGRETLGSYLKGMRYDLTRNLESSGLRPQDQVKEGESRLYPETWKSDTYGEVVGTGPLGFKPLYGQVRNFMGHFGSGTGQGSMININLGNLQTEPTDFIKPVLTPQPTKSNITENQNVAVDMMSQYYKK